MIEYIIIKAKMTLLFLLQAYLSLVTLKTNTLKMIWVGKIKQP
tara:strand:- start:16 stop:144 length:129 start_codon:yes stop_codon:yes gene_type:complete